MAQKILSGKLSENDKKVIECWREIEASNKRFDKKYKEIMRALHS